MSWIKKIFGSSKTENASSPAIETDPVASQHHAAVDAYWESVGKTDDDLITYLINPGFQGAPMWPNTRQAYRIVRTPDTLILASDGLSDPYPNDDSGSDRRGFGMEVFIEVKGLQELLFSEITSHWVFRALQNMSMNVAQVGGLVPVLEEHGVLSIELPIDTGPEKWMKENGFIGALIDIPISGGRANVISDTPLSQTRIVPITILYPQEIDLCATSGASRKAIADELVTKGYGHLTDVSRPSIR